MARLRHDFFDGDTLAIARMLLGKYLVRNRDGTLLAGRITETEAYIGRCDKACHAYNYRRTPRTETLFLGPGVPVYAGMIVGACNRNEDMAVNVCKKKQLTNMRAAGSDAAIRLVPPTVLSLEQCMEYLADDELLEVTPHALRIRKTILNHEKRMKATHGGKK